MIEHHKARRLAMQGLCCLDVQGEGGMGTMLEFIRDGRVNPETITEAESIARSVFDRLEEIDQFLSGQSRHWKVARMGLVERNILRLAVWELLADHAPKKVVIDEALRLAKEFASAESAGFVNGVLDAVVERIGRDAG
ncbi:MAG: transcription antitermination factor NusB [Planctomycetota bacterium]|nr:transcription antitermination factor NusB [Planctomycetota bacterium]